MDLENITTFDAKTHLSSLLEKVQDGKRVCDYETRKTRSKVNGIYRKIW